MVKHVTATECEEAYNKQKDHAVQCARFLNDCHNYLMNKIIARCEDRLKALEATNER